MGSRDTTNLKKLEDLGDGRYKWKIRFKYVDPVWKGGGHMRVIERIYEGTLQQAQGERDHLRLYLRQGEDPDEYPRAHADDPSAERRRVAMASGEHHTFGSLEPVYRDHRAAQGLAPTTYQTENRCLTERILPEIENWLIADAKLKSFQDVVLRWHTDLVATDQLSPATINKWVRVMKHFVGWCCRRVGVSHVARDLKGVAKPKKRRGTALTQSQAQTFLGGVKALCPQYYALSYLAAYTGQRWGTLSALRWEDVDEENNLLHFRRSQSLGEVKDGSKTGHELAVPLDPFSAVLRDHREMMKDRASFHTGWVFCADGDPEELAHDGLMVHNSSITKAYARVCREVGLPRITMHDLRRTFVSIALANGISPPVIQALTGHSDQMIGHYHHQSTDSKGALIGTVMGTTD